MAPVLRSPLTKVPRWFSLRSLADMLAYRRSGSAKLMPVSASA